MNTESRDVVYDDDLKIEAYHLQGIVQPFPNHFHDYYVVGYIEAGNRNLTCAGKQYVLKQGDITLFNPRDAHACTQADQQALDYRCLNIPVETARMISKDIFGSPVDLRFSNSVVSDADMACSLRDVHAMIMHRAPAFIKEEEFLLFMEQLIVSCCEGSPPSHGCRTARLMAACTHMETHYDEQITLDTLADTAQMSKYHFIREFSKEYGLTPYQYLETIRIGHAKQLLEHGLPALDAAMRIGFVDQSHFSKFFKRLIGLTPGQYRDIFHRSTQEEIPPVS